jgi:hypothetical protein
VNGSVKQIGPSNVVGSRPVLVELSLALNNFDINERASRIALVLNLVSSAGGLRRIENRRRSVEGCHTVSQSKMADLDNRPVT